MGSEVDDGKWLGKVREMRAGDLRLGIGQSRPALMANEASLGEEMSIDMSL